MWDLKKGGSALTLFVTWIFADNTDNTFAADNTAKFAERFNGGTDAHTGVDKEGESGGTQNPAFGAGGRMSNTEEKARKLDFDELFTFVESSCPALK